MRRSPDNKPRFFIGQLVYISLRGELVQMVITNVYRNHGGQFDYRMNGTAQPPKDADWFEAQIFHQSNIAWRNEEHLVLHNSKNSNS